MNLIIIKISILESMEKLFAEQCIYIDKRCPNFCTMHTLKMFSIFQSKHTTTKNEGVHYQKRATSKEIKDNPKAAAVLAVPSSYLIVVWVNCCLESGFAMPHTP